MVYGQTRERSGTGGIAVENHVPQAEGPKWVVEGQLPPRAVRLPQAPIAITPPDPYLLGAVRV
ncbi:hypothetical protein [uncultured Meiothermus sp.]|uniref:hypothetical protein n=1 Tax=uncultured Meiothermus sp. TaxID=157471 RepID=UPI00261839D8|nr:hypothetical protein [uncultured Meiothermus sp.]